MQVLSNEQLRQYTPSVFAATPWERMSSQYRFVPTIEVIDLPVRAQQSRTRIPGKGNFTKHILRFRHQDYLTNLNVEQDTLDLGCPNEYTNQLQNSKGMIWIGLGLQHEEISI